MKANDQYENTIIVFTSDNGGQHHPYMPFRLYDLAADPLEQLDVSVENRLTYEALSESLRNHLRRAGAVQWQKPE